jgi:hypothetical protein
LEMHQHHTSFGCELKCPTLPSTKSQLGYAILLAS